MLLAYCQRPFSPLLKAITRAMMIYYYAFACFDIEAIIVSYSFDDIAITPFR